MANKNQKRVRAEKTAKTGAGVISAAPKRNMQQVVSHNVDNRGKKYSVTNHEAIKKDRPVVFPNHGYMSYRVPTQNRSR